MESASTSNTKENKTSTMTTDQIGAVLSTTPPIVERILQNLSNMHQLNQCASVCKLWHDVAQEIKKGKTDIIRLFMVYKQRDYDEHLSVCSSREICVAKCKYDVGDHFYDVINGATSEPKLVILFASDKVFDKPQQFFKNFIHYPARRTMYGKRRRMSRVLDSALDDQISYGVPLIDFLKYYLPRKCQIIGCGASGIVGTPISKSVPLEVESSPGLTALFLPSLPGIEIYQFKILTTHEEAFRKGKPIGRTFINKITGIPENKHIECLLTFFHDIPEHIFSAKVVIQHYLQEENYKMALGGAVVDEIAVQMSATNDEWPLCVGIAFTGKNVKAASVILECDIKTKEAILEKLKKLRECTVPEDNIMAFMFACCGRGYMFYNESNVEAEMFHKVFPKVPLIGVFGRGEIGVEFLPTYNKSEKNFFHYQKVDTSKNNKWFHEYTTIIVLLSLGKFTKE